MQKNSKTQSDTEWLSTMPIAHRGLHSPEHPENTLGAFRAAIAANVAIELDVRCTADDRLVVIHDANTQHATQTDYHITQQTYATLSSLKLYDSEYGIMTLEAVLTEINGAVPVVIEVKDGTAAQRICPLLRAILQPYTGDHAVMSFDPRIVLWFKRHAPEVPRGLLSGTMRYHGDDLNPVVRIFLQSLIGIALCRPHFVAYDIDALPSKAVSFWQRFTQFKLLVWPVLTEGQRQKAASYNANIIFENYNTDPYRTPSN